MASRSDQTDNVQPEARHAYRFLCPECAYNLTGLSENRCPECGSPFDPQALLEILAGRPQPIPGWDDSRANVFGKFFRACLWTWFHPAEFGRRFPWRYDPLSIPAFWFAVRIAAIVPISAGLMFMSILSGDSHAVAFFVGGSLAGAFFVAVGSVACEAALVHLLKLTVRPRFNPILFSWWGFITFHGSFLVLSVYGCALLPGLWTVYEPIANAATWAVGSVALVSIGWWWYAVSKGIVVRTHPGFGRTIAILLIPVIGAAAVLVFAVLPISFLLWLLSMLSD